MKILVPALALAASTSAASAFEFLGGEAYLEGASTQLDSSGFTEEYTHIIVGGAGSFAITEQFGFDAYARLGQSEIDSVGFSYDLQNFGVSPWYQIAPQARVGVFYEQHKATFDSFDTDWTIYGIEGSYQFSEMFTLSAYAGQYDVEEFDQSITTFGLLGELTLKNGMIVSLSVEQDNYDEFDQEFTEVGLGLSYDFSQTSNVPIVLAGGYSQITENSLGDVSYGRFFIKVSYEFGKNGAPSNALLGNHGVVGDVTLD